jgi:hypothetical protein
MFRYHKTKNNKIIAELTDNKLIISETQDATDLLGNLVFEGCNTIIIHERNLHPDFFDLKTRLAGDILQKFSNYCIKLAVVGDFSKYTSKSLRDFIYESNKRNNIIFVDTFESALLKFEK